MRDIDAAISREAPDVKTEPSKEGNLEKEEISLNRNVDRLETKEGSHANGLVTEAQSQTLALGPQGPIMKMEHQPGDVLSLSQLGINFKMGHISLKQPKPHKTKKTTRGGQKKNKENRGYVGKNTDSGKDCMQLQGERKGVEMLMEVNKVEVGIKRRLRSPLHELGNCVDNGKKARMEGEVKEFGKLLAHHLGSRRLLTSPAGRNECH